MPQQHDNPGGHQQAQRQAWQNICSLKNAPLQAGPKVRSPCQRHPRDKAQACHWGQNLDTPNTRQPRRILSSSTRHQKLSWSAWITHGEAQDPTQKLPQLPWCWRGGQGKELILYSVGSKALLPLKKKYIGIGDFSVLAMIDCLCLKMAIMMAMVQKHDYNTMGYSNLWDPTTSITVYSHSSTTSRYHLAIMALGQVKSRKQWRQEHKCGRAR